MENELRLMINWFEKKVNEAEQEYKEKHKEDFDKIKMNRYVNKKLKLERETLIKVNMLPSALILETTKRYNLIGKNERRYNLIVKGNIDCGNIDFYAIAIAYYSFKCKSAKARRNNCILKCLDSEIEYKKEVTA